MKIIMILGTGVLLTFPTIDPTIEAIKPDCFSQGYAILGKLGTYHGPGPNQGWVLNDSNVQIAGWYCK